MKKSILSDLEKLCPNNTFSNVSLAKVSRWKIGGKAKILLQPSSQKEISEVKKYFNKYDIPYIIIGATSNLLFSDEGLKIPCIQIGQNLSKINVKGSQIEVEAGAWAPMVARQAMLAGLTGLEHSCGIPGSFGGLVCMNGGSQQKGVGEKVIYVVTVNKFGRVNIYPKSACKFGYRSSTFQGGSETIVKVLLQLNPATEPKQIRAHMLNILKERKKKFPQNMPNCGSVFKSNPNMYDNVGPPGVVIEKLGFKGRQIGDALVSPVHANFIVNLGNARANDVLMLIKEIQLRVRAETGYFLESEAVYVSSDGQMLPAGLKS